MLRSPSEPILKSQLEMDAMQRAGEVAATLHSVAREVCRPGITTARLDATLAEAMTAAGCQGLFKGYTQGASPQFPGHSCISVNSEVVHGVPGDREIRPGDLVSVDIGIAYEGWCADRATSILLDPEESASPHRRDRHRALESLIEATRGALALAIEEIRVGRWWSEVARQMESWAIDKGHGIVTQYVGHGIGRSLHEPPKAPAFFTSYKGKDFRLEEGMVIAVEPMLTAFPDSTPPPESAEPWRTRVGLDRDGWTVRTLDGSISCHEEQVIGVSSDGARVLTPAMPAGEGPSKPGSG